MPPDEDPDTFIRSRGKAALEATLDEAVPLADYYFTWLEQRHGKTLEGKSQIASEVSRVLAKVNNAFEVDLLIRRAVDMLGIREELLRRPPGRPVAVNVRQALSVAIPKNRDEVAQRSLAGLMLRFWFRRAGTTCYGNKTMPTPWNASSKALKSRRGRWCKQQFPRSF